MRDYKARPRSKAKKAPRRPPTPRFGRHRASAPKGFRPLAAPRPLPSTRDAARRASKPPGNRPPRTARAWNALRAWSLRRIALWGALAWLLAALVTGAVALRQAPLREVRLTGNHVVPAAAVLRLGGLVAGMPMSAVDPYETARRIATHPRLTTVDVRRLYPGRVAIRVRERQAALRVRLDDGSTALVDPDDVVLSLLKPGAPLPPELAALPLVAGVHSTPQLSEALADPALQRARAALSAVKRLGLGAGAPLAIDAGDPFLLGLGLPDGTRLIVPPDRLQATLQTYRSTRRAYPAAFQGHHTIDLTPLDAHGGGRIVLRAD